MTRRREGTESFGIMSSWCLRHDDTIFIMVIVDVTLYDTGACATAAVTDEGQYIPGVF